MKELSDGIFADKGKLYTENLVPGIKVYGEALAKKDGKELREWDPTRSKMAAAIMKKIKTIPLKEGSIIFYLGAASGTTISHFSDIVKRSGLIYGIEFAERVFRNLIEIAGQRKNIAPLFADARLPEKYFWVEDCDIVYADIAQPDQTEIALRNAHIFLKKGGFLFVTMKARSIDVTKDPKQIYKEEAAKISGKNYKIIEVVDLEPFEDSHAMIVAEKGQ
ncbi:MAG: fibrillarin-like rRNA/tRNA 2'-O-methyltransferase [Candidatus Aenigmarchaeota archaeon]|nr:fibrillarin-like rRNA/tRNA 2'-O-methyltransferase [Candidatus Aenigmarchaeota archaeon]